MLLGSGGGRSACLWHCPLLVLLEEQASGRRLDCSGLGHVTRRCFGTKWYNDVRSARDGDTGNEDDSSFAGILNLTSMPCSLSLFSCSMFTSGLASDSDKFKITITLLRVQKFEDIGPYNIFNFSYNPLVFEFFFAISAKIHCPRLGTLGTNGLSMEHI